MSAGLNQEVYAHIVSTYPWLVILFDLSLVLICGPIGVWYGGLPDFSSPYRSLAPKGTSIQGRDMANLLLTQGVMQGNYTFLPGESFLPYSEALIQSSSKLVEITSSRTSTATNTSCDEEILAAVTVMPIPPTMKSNGIMTESTALPRLVVQTKSPSESLWSAKHMHDICSIVDHYIINELSPQCEPHSLPYYITLITGKECMELTDLDMKQSLALLQQCAEYYFSGELTLSCQYTTCKHMPSTCTHNNVVFYIFHYFTDIHFLNNGTINETHLRYSQIIFRRSWNISVDRLYDYYNRVLSERVIENGAVEIKAMDMDVLFGKINSDSILWDLPYYGLAMALVVIVLFFYLRSVILMITVIANVVLTIMLSYFINHVVYRISYFGFGNVLAALLLIAVGADGVFIFHDIWHKIKREAPKPELLSIEDVCSQTTKHAILSILMTSLTTAAAIFSNAISNIIGLRVFGIFGGTCMLVNLFFMATLVPAVLVILERLTRKYPKACGYKCAESFTFHFRKLSNYFWGTLLPAIVLKGSLVWIFLLLGLGTCGFIAVFYTPKLRLQSSDKIQAFYSEHPIEIYRMKLKDQFRFEIENMLVNRRRIELKFILGVKGDDNSNVLDPESIGVLVFDDQFNIYKAESQLWLQSLCHNLLEDRLIYNASEYTCFMDSFASVVNSSCVYPHLSLNKRCCETQFPLSESDAQFCYGDKSFIQIINMRTPIGQKLIGIPLYDNRSHVISHMLQVTTNEYWSSVYSPMHEYYTHYAQFIKHELLNAPQEVDCMWFTGAYGKEFFFYDLQLTLVGGLISGIVLSLSVAFLVMLFTSNNFFLTIYAIVNIILVITTTVGALVLLGWELTVTEAIIVTVAVGLSIDFTIHFGVAYKVSNETTRAGRVKDSISTVGFAVAMAALTTFVSGTALLGGRVLSYWRFGLFLMLNMTISWTYTMFFFLPVCKHIGPVGHSGELTYMFKYCCFKFRGKGSGRTDIVIKKDINNVKIRNNNTIYKSLIYFKSDALKEMVDLRETCI